MKLTPILILIASSVILSAETEETVSKRLPAQPGGKLVVDVDFGSIEVSPNANNEVTIDVVRKVRRKSKADEEQFLADRPVTISQDGNTITVLARPKSKPSSFTWFGSQKNEGKYVITVPASFHAQLKTAGGGISANDLTGDLKANTSGGGLKFSGIRGSLNGQTSGGGIRLSDCHGPLSIHTSGGGIQVNGGSGSLKGGSSGGSVSVKNFKGPADVETSGGGITIENVTGKVSGSTSGGSISARFDAPISEEVSLETSGGGVTVRVTDNSAFDLDASTSGGGVSSDLPVTVTGKPSRNHLKGPVNGGGKPVILRTSGGSIHVKKV